MMKKKAIPAIPGKSGKLKNEGLLVLETGCCLQRCFSLCVTDWEDLK